MDFPHLFRYLNSHYYCDLIVAVLDIIGILIGLKYVRKSSMGRMFIFYLGFDLIVILICFYLFLNTNNTPEIINDYSSITNALVAFIELTVYYLYFKIILRNKFSRYFKTTFFIFLILMLIYLITKFNFLTERLRYISNILTVTEFLFLLPPCFFFYYQLLKRDSYFNIIERPTFWIVTGIFIFSTISIPYYLISNYLAQNIKGLSSSLLANLFFYIPICINILFLTKGILCKKALTI